MVSLYFVYMIAASKILVEPQSQTVLINENATFQCNTSEPAKWKINNEIYDPVDGLPPNLTERVFTPTPGHAQGVFSITLIVLGLPLNNNTEIQCLIQTDSTPLTSALVTLLVIGIYNNIMWE